MIAKLGALILLFVLSSAVQTMAQVAAKPSSKKIPMSREQFLQLLNDPFSSTAEVPLRVRGAPFCLRVAFKNEFYVWYSKNAAGAGTFEGDCPERKMKFVMVDGIGFYFRYRDEGPRHKSCANTSLCTFQEENYGIGKMIECVKGVAKRGRDTVSVSTSYYCP